MRQVVQLFIKRTWMQHSLFWLLSLFIISYHFAISNTVESVDFIYALFFHFSLFPLVYGNLRILIPKFLHNEKYVLYGVFTLILLALAYGVHEITFELLIPNLPLEYYMVSFTDPYILLTILIIYLIISTLLNLSKSWFQLEHIRTEAAKTELYNLRLQINPHFLLNSLNSIYGLALKKDNKTPEAILKLSELLKHMLYETEDLIDLEVEIENIQNFIALQTLRLNHTDNISITINVSSKKRKIAAFLLLTFVENAFKHSDLQVNPNGFIVIDIIENDYFQFAIKNTRKQEVQQQHKGIGIENARKRLDIYYPEKHKLIIDGSVNNFSLKLAIDKL